MVILKGMGGVKLIIIINFYCIFIFTSWAFVVTDGGLGTQIQFQLLD